MLAKCHSGAVYGVEAAPVEIEVCSSNGNPQFAIVGLPDQAVKEAKERVTTAIENSRLGRIESNITVNLAPADVRKEGPIYDLAIAVALLVAKGMAQCANLSDFAIVGELALSGEVRRIRGILPIVLEMRRIGVKGMLVPAENADEAAVVEGICVYPVRTLREAVDFLSGAVRIEPAFTDLAGMVRENTDFGDDFADVKGQEVARRAIEVAVAGGHNLLMVGSPGSGKTMLARRIPSILPPLTVEEGLEVRRVYSVAGLLKSRESLVVRRPFRSPHHTVSDIGLLGGGAHPGPGEVSLAHRGVLFLDEFPEFRRNVLEVLRQPLEDGRVSISRAAAACDFPSRFMLVAAMNPCPCGFLNDPRRECRCSRRQVDVYRAKISGPLLDRIDLQIEVPPVPFKALGELPAGESSAVIRSRVIAARELQRRRYAGMPGVHCNADVKSRHLADACRMSEDTRSKFRLMLSQLDFSARAHDRVLKVARTIADLRGSEDVTIDDLAEATTYRSLDQKTWG